MDDEATGVAHSATMSGGAVLVVTVLWFALAVGVSSYAQSKGYSTTSFAVMSVLLSPIVSGVIALVAPARHGPTLAMAHNGGAGPSGPSAAPEPAAATAQRDPAIGGLLAAAGGSALMIGGSIGPWATLGVFHANGLEGGRDGWITIVLGILGLLTAWGLYVSASGSSVWLGLFGIGGLITTIYDGNDISNRHATFLGNEISPEVGWGLYLAGIGSAILLLAAIALAGPLKARRRTVAPDDYDPIVSAGEPSPTPPETVAAARSDVGWKPDPTGRHEQRFWDGSGWTDNVMDGQSQSRDAL